MSHLVAEHVVAMVIRTQVTRTEARNLLQWLDCEAYILPAKRTLVPALADAILDHCRPRRPLAQSNYLFDAWYYSEIAQDYLTKPQQELVALILDGELA